jgi:Flp pilus assembly protein TadD
LPIHVNLAIVHARKKEFAKAERVLRNALTIDKKYPRAHAVLGAVLMDLGQFSEAEASTQAALDLLPPDDPMRPGIEKQLAICRQLQKQESR